MISAKIAVTALMFMQASGMLMSITSYEDYPTKIANLITCVFWIALVTCFVAVLFTLWSV